MNSNEHKVGKVNLTFLATVLISVLGTSVITLICKVINLCSSGFGTSIYKFLLDDYFMLIIVSQILLFLPSFIFIIFNRKYFFSNLRIKSLKVKTYLWIAMFGVFFIPIISFINSISLLFTKNVMAQEITGVVNSHSLLSSMVVIAVIPCILEETVYRGVFYNEYSRINPVKAMVLTGFLFGLLHMNLNQFMYAAVGGIVFAIMVEATGSITSSIIMHFMINGTSTLVSYYSSQITDNVSQQAEDIATSEGVQGFTGVMSFMNNLTAIQQAVVSLGIVALICTVFEIVIFTQILISEERKEYFFGLFRRDKIKNSPSEDNDCKEDVCDTGVEKNETKMITPTLVVAIVICIIIIGIRHFLLV